MKNWKTKVVSTALALSVLAPTAAFAADAVTTIKDVPFKKGFAQHQRFDAEQRQQMQDKMLEVVSKYTPESLTDWQNALTDREQLMSELKEKAPANKQRPQVSDEVKAKLQTIREEVKNGNMTQEQAREEMKNLGLGKERPNKHKLQVSDEVKAKLQTIREDVKNGTMTQEQAREEMKNLGLGKERPDMQKPQVSDEVKEKLQAIREDVKNGNMTHEQARVEMQNLGLEGKRNFGGDFSADRQLKGDFKEAVEANDEAKIKEMLPHLLEQLKERNQKLSDKLSELNQ